jgi:hypothetical protein
MPPDQDPGLRDMARRLTSERPIPHPAFRGRLRRDLLGTGDTSTRPRRVRGMIAAYSASGAVLLAVVAVGLAGLGPLAA